MAVEIINSKTDFEEKVKSGKYVVDFFATWCGPCKMLSPVLDQIAPDLEAEDVTIIKVDVDQAPDLAEKFGVMSIPTLLLVKDGEHLATEQGFKPANQLIEWAKGLQ